MTALDAGRWLLIYITPPELRGARAAQVFCRIEWSGTAVHDGLDGDLLARRDAAMGMAHAARARGLRPRAHKRVRITRLKTYRGGGDISRVINLLYSARITHTS